jgi:hypothetical protein
MRSPVPRLLSLVDLQPGSEELDWEVDVREQEADEGLVYPRDPEHEARIERLDEAVATLDPKLLLASRCGVDHEVCARASTSGSAGPPGCFKTIFPTIS